jgi:GABA(A) receptor-associated protein
MTSNFKAQYDFESRINESSRIREKYEARVPIIVTRSNTEKIIPEISRRKFLVPKDLSMAQFLYVIRKRISLSSDKSLYLFVGESSNLVPSSQTVGQIDHDYRDDDGYVYIQYSGESTFG